MDAVANLSAASYLTQSSNTDGTRRASELQSAGSGVNSTSATEESQAVEQSLAESSIARAEQTSAASVELVTPTGKVSSDAQLGSLINTTA